MQNLAVTLDFYSHLTPPVIANRTSIDLPLYYNILILFIYWSTSKLQSDFTVVNIFLM